MTDRSKLLALAEAVEKLTGPDREVDMAIQLEAGNVPEHYERAVSHGKPLMWFWHKTNSRAPFVTPKFYTDSIDAAMTLVPEKRFVGDLNQCDAGGEWYALINAHDADYEDAVAKTAALALTAAALRAQAAACLRSQAEALS